MNLVLTFDYELFGDGSGDVFEHMVKPTQRILQICGDHDIKTTIFVEVIEYLKLKEEWESGNRMGYRENPVTAIETQLQEAALDGHDIQLHIHPQWVNADFKNSSWNVDLDNWRLGDFESATDYGIEELIADGKNALEALIQPVEPQYKCIAFRAGAFNIMPSSKVFSALKSLDIKLDSSVYPGGHEQGDLSRYDYRNVPLSEDFWWADANDIRKAAAEKSDLMEIPLFALPQRRIHKLLNIEKIKSLVSKKNNAVSSVARSKISNLTLLEKVQFLFQKEAFTWDFCLFSGKLHKTFFSEIESWFSDQRSTFVLIGHPKSYRSDRSLETLIKQAQTRHERYRFKTLKEVYEEFSK